MSESENIFMRTRDFKKICANVFDILVVGGGVHGATIACHAAKAGFRTVLVEKNDFCSATSANSLKILHGGLRYLQHLNIKRMRHSILARREMMQLAPHLVKPLPCMMPLYGNGLRGKRVMQAALLVNDCISWDRNRDLPADVHLPRGRIVSKEYCQNIISDLEIRDLQGASVWYDVLAVNTERMVMEYVLESLEHGALAVNYAEAADIEKEEEFYGVTLLDRLSQETHRLKTRYIINAAGPWFEQSLGCKTPVLQTKQQWVMALNIVSKKQLFAEYAVALEGKSTYEDKDAIVKRGKRLYFFVPWRGCTMIGTNYEKSIANPDDLQVRREAIQEMVDEVNAIYPGAELKYDDISFYQAGLLPMRGETEHGDIQLEKNSTFYEHLDLGFDRIFSVKGVKYTTAPHLAHEIVHYLQKHYPPGQGRKQRKDSLTEKGTLGTELPEVRELLEERYGQRAIHIFAHLRETDNDIWLDERARLLKAEIRYLIADEMACRLPDIVFRRTGLGSAICPGQDLLTKLSAFMGSILGWNVEREEKEVEDVLLRYQPLTVEDPVP
jgi:glycerol-3-phosphate dehydrogenase